MPGTVIGKYYNNGYPGTYAEQGDHLVKTFPNAGDAEMDFGSPVFALNDGVATPGSTDLTPSATNFKGVAVAHVQTANAYNPQSLGQYAVGQPVPVMERGGIAVFCDNFATNAPVVDGPVYVRVSNAGDDDGLIVGEFEAVVDPDVAGNTLLLTNATWGSTADANGVALLILKTRINS